MSSKVTFFFHWTGWQTEISVCSKVIREHITRSSGLAKTYREQFKEEDKEADRGNDGKTTAKSGLALNGISYYGKLRTARSGGSWL